MCSASVSVFGFLASIYRAIVFRASIGLVIVRSSLRYTGYRVQGFVAEDTSEDGHIYEPVTCPVCHQTHHVNPHTGVVLDEKAAALRPASSSK